MHQMGLVCNLTLSVIAGAVLAPALGEVQPIFLRNHPSVFEGAVFVMAAVAAGVAAHTIWAVPRDSLECILPLGVAFNSAGRRRLVWDGLHVNRNLRKHKFLKETLSARVGPVRPYGPDDRRCIGRRPVAGSHQGPYSLHVGRHRRRHTAACLDELRWNIPAVR